ncbi:MAG: VCBS repeat-containing protein, partial [Pseudomonadota bacterium]
NMLLRNDRGVFHDVARAVGLDLQLHEENGGSNGGMVAGDFNSDGWPDLYLSVFLAPRRLFLNGGQGSFVDATSGDIPTTGEAFGVAAGDIDNDGDLDLLTGTVMTEQGPDPPHVLCGDRPDHGGSEPAGRVRRCRSPGPGRWDV